MKLQIHKIEARDLPDLWFQAVYDVLEVGRTFKIDKGSYAGSTRLEYDYFIGHVQFPGTTPTLPDIPAHYGIPNPVEHDNEKTPYRKHGRKTIKTTQDAMEAARAFAESVS